MTTPSPEPGPSQAPIIARRGSSPRGRSVTPAPIEFSTHSAPPSRSGSPRGRRPPSYARSSLDRSPHPNPMMPDNRPSVPPPIYLRSSSPAAISTKGTLKIHIPAWGVAMVKPPRRLELHPLEDGGREPPTEDTVVTGALEVIMKERRRCVAISVGVQMVCRLHLGVERGWEEDGVFERGVEILGGSAEGIWLEKGSQSFTFSILLPATIATNDYHQFGRVSAILTARVEGSQATSSISNIFKREVVPTGVSSDIPFKEDFDTVIARSDKVAHGHRSNSRDSPRDATMPPALSAGLNEGPPDESAISMGDQNPSVTGLYHRQQSADFSRQSSSFNPSRLGVDDDGRPINTSRTTGNDVAAKLEKHGWLKGDMTAMRSLIIHANPDPLGGVCQLDVRKEGMVAGIGSWRFTASSDVFAISAVLILSLSIPSPGPPCTIFFTRLLLSQTYKITSPRTPNDAPHQPEQIRNHVLYQVGKPHKVGDRFPGHEVEALWRGTEAGGAGDIEEGGWRTRAVARMPVHEKIRPSTNDGTITPIRVSHEMILQVFYSVQGETVAGGIKDGPGELRMMAVKMPVLVPSCTISSSAVNLPSYEFSPSSSENIDDILSSPPSKNRCMCGSTFAELGEAAMRRLHEAEAEDVEERERVRLGFTGMSLEGGGSGDATEENYQARKEESERRGSLTPGTGRSGG